MRYIVFAAMTIVLLTACAGQDDSVIEQPAGPTPTRAAAALLTPEPEIQPIRFPEDEAPHDMLTEWWYYTGHMFTEDGDRYGFEYVFFQAIRGGFPPYYAAHFAITDNPAGRFVYDEKAGPDAIRETDAGFSLELDGWTMSGALGEDVLFAEMDGYAIDLALSATKPPALHNDIGYVDFGPAGGSYYYSRTNMHIEGTLTVDGETFTVDGEAWMAHRITFNALSLSFMPAMGMAMAATAIVGQATGARDPLSARRAAGISATYAAIWMSMIGVVYFFCGGYIMRIFSSDPDVIAQGAGALRVLALSQPFWAWMLVYSGSMRGIGNSRYPMVVNSLTLWLAVIIGLGLVRGFDMGLGFVWSAFLFVSPVTILLLRRRLMSDPLMNAPDDDSGTIPQIPETRKIEPAA